MRNLIFEHGCGRIGSFHPFPQREILKKEGKPEIKNTYSLFSRQTQTASNDPRLQMEENEGFPSEIEEKEREIPRFHFLPLPNENPRFIKPSIYEEEREIPTRTRKFRTKNIEEMRRDFDFYQSRRWRERDGNTEMKSAKGKAERERNGEIFILFIYWGLGGKTSPHACELSFKSWPRVWT